MTAAEDYVMQNNLVDKLITACILLVVVFPFSVAFCLSFLLRVYCFIFFAFSQLICMQLFIQIQKDFNNRHHQLHFKFVLPEAAKTFQLIFNLEFDIQNFKFISDTMAFGQKLWLPKLDFPFAEKRQFRLKQIRAKSWAVRRNNKKPRY